MGGQGQGHQAGPGFLAGKPEVQARRWGEGSRRGNLSNRSDCHTLARLLRTAHRVLYLQQQPASPSASAGQSSLCASIFPGCLY